MTIFLRVKLFQLREQLRVIFRYYRNIRFALVDIGFCIWAFFCNPYRICRKFSGTHSYGETPISTFAELARVVGLTKDDLFVDLGAGRGKLCFWTALWIGCNCVGVEQVPKFVRQAKLLAWLFRAPVRFENGLMETADISKATVVYLYTMQWDETLLTQMRTGARLITVGAPVTCDGFELMGSLVTRYPWGVADAYIQRRV